MKYAPLSVLILTQFVCLAAMLRMPFSDVPVAELFYVCVATIFHCVGLRGLTYGLGEETQEFYRFYWWFLCGSVLVSAGLAAKFSLIHGWRITTPLIISTIVWAICVGAAAIHWIRDAYKGVLYEAFVIAAAQGIAYLITGVLTVVSLMAPHKPSAFALRLGYGLYWFGLAVIAFAFAIGIIRKRALWEALNTQLPACLGIVVFLSLAVFFWRAQRELTRQHSVSTVQQVVFEDGE